MCLHNIITQTQSQSGSTAGWFSSKERLKDLVNNALWNAIAIISHAYFNFLPSVFSL